MEQGNEGDEIVLYTLSQIGCNLDNSITSLSQLGAETFVKVVVKALYLISDGELKYSEDLPTNLASRHRICTEIANKIKDLGYNGDCGYNQLLYPTGIQTRSILNWLLPKLPRPDDVVEENLSSDALLNSRIMSEIVSWKSECWKVDVCISGYLSKRCYNTIFSTDTEYFTTFPKSHLYRPRFMKLRSIVMEPSVLQLHSCQLMDDIKYSSEIISSANDDITSSNGNSNTTFSTTLKSSIPSEFARNMTRSSFQSYLSSNNNSNTNSNGSNSNNSSNGINNQSVIYSSVWSENTDKSLSDIIDSVSSIHQQRHDISSRFSHASEYGHEVTTTLDKKVVGSSSIKTGSVDNQEIVNIEEEMKMREAILSEMRLSLESQMMTADNRVRRLLDVNSEIRQLESKLSSNLNISDNLENEIIVKKKTLEMLPTASENIEKLQMVCASGAGRLIQLAQEWESYRRPMVLKLRNINSKRTKKKNQLKVLVNEMKNSKDQMSQIVRTLKDKQSLITLLNDEIKKLPKNINRTVYTYRILDITASIAKQITEIEKVTGDIRDVQKLINQNSSSLQRADVIAEERIYKTANERSNDVQMVEAYRLLRSLRSNFDDLIGVISKIGFYEKQARQLETKIEQESSRVSNRNMTRILNDLDEVLKGNALLIEDIKKLKNSAH